MRKIFDLIDHGTRVLSIIFLLVLVIGVFGNVLFRYVFSLPIRWTEEICTLLLVWIVFLGAASLQKMEGHITIDIIYLRCSSKVRKAMEIFGRIFTIGILAFLILSSIKAVVLQSRSMTMLLGMPVSFFGAAVLVGSVLMFLYTILSLKNKLLDYFVRHEDAGPESNISQERNSS